MPISAAQVLVHLTACQTATTTHQKGVTLEAFARYLFSELPGVRVVGSNIKNANGTEEIDVACWNDKLPNGLPFWPNIVLIECKNWGKPVGSEEVAWFLTKLKNRGLSHGVLIAKSGITGNQQDWREAQSLLRSDLREGRRLVVLDFSKIGAVTSDAELVRLLQDELCQLMLR